MLLLSNDMPNEGQDWGYAWIPSKTGPRTSLNGLLNLKVLKPVPTNFYCFVDVWQQ